MDTRSKFLHELYLASLGGGSTMEPAWAMALEASFGSVEGWCKEFVAMADALGGGSGWVLLSFQPRDGMLVNHWATEHVQVPDGAVPVLALDMHEQPGHVADGTNAGAYVDEFMRNIAWAGVYARYQAAVHDASEPFGAAASEIGDAIVLDVRRAAVFDAAQVKLPGARWLDPAAVAAWAPSLPEDRDVVVYCVYGHEVGRSTALKLRAAGRRARYLRGGIDGWQKDGQPLVAKGDDQAMT